MTQIKAADKTLRIEIKWYVSWVSDDVMMLYVLLQIVQGLQCKMSLSSFAAPFDDETVDSKPSHATWLTCDPYQSSRTEMDESSGMAYSVGVRNQKHKKSYQIFLTTRFIAGMWYLFTLIMVSSYTANLAASLTAENLHTPINSAEDLANQNVIKYGCLGDGSTHNFFKVSWLITS